MKNRYKLLSLTILWIGLLFTGCSNFDQLNTNPDTPVDATSDLMATRLLWNIAGPSAAKTMCIDFIRSKYMGWQEGALEEQYNYFGRTGYNYSILTTGQKMIEKSVGIPTEDAYTGLFLFIKAYKLFHLTAKVGDIPYSEALQGENQIFKPKYDTQKEVFIQILQDLDDAYTHFETFKKNASSFKGDIIYNGNPEKWQKAISVLQMKILISLSNKENDSDLKIKERFSSILEKQLLFDSNADNFQLVYKNQTGMVNPFHHTQTKHATYVLLSDMLVDSLKKYEDYRLFYYASPAVGLVEKGEPEDSWNAFSGVDITLPYTDMGEIGSMGLCSQLNKRYTDTEEAEPFAKLRFSDMNFYIAEAALRGWIKKDASAYYLKAIRADLEFEQTYMRNDIKYHYGRIIDEAYITQYLAKEAIQLTDDFEVNLNKILTQKYLSNFLQVYELDGYMDYRRTGYPEFPINPATNQNPKTDKIPVRFMYPTAELGYNSENVTEAIQRQFNGNDEVNELMWLLKK